MGTWAQVHLGKICFPVAVFCLVRRNELTDLLWVVGDDGMCALGQKNPC